MNKQVTLPTKKSDIKRNWYLFDVKNKVLGRVATEIAEKLTGKSKPYFVRNLDCGDYVIVTNAKYINVSGKKETDKVYSRYSGYPGGLKKIPLWKMREQKPTEIIRHAVFGMLPKNKIRNRLIVRLFVYPKDEHPYKDKVTFAQ